MSCKFFCSQSELVGTSYHEFYKGTFDGTSFWAKDSIFISDDVHYELGFEDLFISVISEYDVLGETEVNEKQWKEILLQAEKIGGDTYKALIEADIWVRETFRENSVFTMIGM